MGFSQGCSLASSFLLAHQASNPTSPPPFKAAIFIFGGVPLDVLASHGVEIMQEALDWDQSSKVQLMNQASSSSILTQGQNRWEGEFSSSYLVFPWSSPSKNSTASNSDYGAEFVDREESSSMIFGIDVSRIPRQMKIQIPTVHVFGSRDPRFPAAFTLAQFCEEGRRMVFDHFGGHEIPRTTRCSVALVEAVEWCVEMAGL